jgi:uncharacterized protein (DUF169 family)
MIDDLKNIFGPKCTSIHVNGEQSESINIPTKQLKFCEAVSLSFSRPVRVVDKNLGCPGARRSVGFDKDDTLLAQIISENNGIPVQFVLNALKEIPKLKGITQINLGMTEEMEKKTKPDLYIIYIKPAMVTAIMHNLAKLGVKPSILPYSLLSVCGNVFSNCYKNIVPTLSFGCPESRKHGGIGNDEVVLGLPYQHASYLVNVF